MNWERVGAASGIIVAILFTVSFIVFLGTDPTNAPKIPDLAGAANASEYISEHDDAIKAQLLLNSIATVLFLWFLGSLWSAFRSAEGGPARVSAVASAGAIVGTGALLAGFVFGTVAVQNPNDTAVVGLMYSLDVLSIGLGGAAFTVFFLASAKVIMKHGALPAAIGLLALVAGVASAFGFVSIFAEDGIFNPATGAIGFWARFATFVLFVLFASLALTAGAGRTRSSTTRSTTRRRRR